MSQRNILTVLIEAELSLPVSTADMVFPGRRITLPIVLDDRWNREALQKYMQTTRDKAVYLPSNVQYLANNNGLDSEQEALAKLVQSDWVTLPQYPLGGKVDLGLVGVWRRLLSRVPVPCPGRQLLSGYDLIRST